MNSLRESVNIINFTMNNQCLDFVKQTGVEDSVEIRTDLDALTVKHYVNKTKSMTDTDFQGKNNKI